MRRTGFAALAMVTMALASACASSSPHGEEATTATTLPPFTYHPSDIVLLRSRLAGDLSGSAFTTGTSFTATSLTVDGVAEPMVDGRHLSLSFNGGRLTAEIHCAAIVDAAYEISDDSHLALSDLNPSGAADLSKPGAVDCARSATAADAAAQDTDLFEVLTSSPALTLTDGTMTITGGDMAITLAASTDAPAAPLTGTTWIGTSMPYGRTFHVVGGANAVTLVFGDGGSVAVTVGCNDGSAHYTVDGSNMTVSDLNLSTRTCPGVPTDDPAARLVAPADTITAEVHSLLDGPLTWTIAGPGLQLSASDSTGHDDEVGLDLEAT